MKLCELGELERENKELNLYWMEYYDKLRQNIE